MIQKKKKIFWTKKNVKITKGANPLKGYASCYNVEIINSFNSELKLKDTESAVKKKLKKLLWIKRIYICANISLSA